MLLLGKGGGHREDRRETKGAGIILRTPYAMSGTDITSECGTS